MNGDPALLLRLLVGMLLLLAALVPLAWALGRTIRVPIAVASCLLPLILLAPWLSGSRILLPTGNLANGVPGTGVVAKPDLHARILNDVSHQLAPWEIEVRRHLAAGHLPLWSDLIDGGSSPWSDPQASVLSPTSLPARLLPTAHHFLASLALKIQLAFLGTWIAARQFALGRRAALLAALGFSIGGGILAWGLFPHAAAGAWAPWCLAAFRRLGRRGDTRTVVGSVLTVAGLLLSGQPEVAFGVGILAACALVAARRRRDGLRPIGRLLLAGVLGFGLAAPLVMPFLFRVVESQRAADQSGHAKTPGKRRPSGSLEQAERILRAPFSPWANGVPYEEKVFVNYVEPLSAYSGLVTIAGLAALVVLPGSRRRAAFLLFVGGAGFLVASRLPWVQWVWARLPLLNLLAARNLLPLAVLALVLAGALGLDRMLRAPRGAPRWPAVSAMAMALAACYALVPETGVALIGLAVVTAALAASRRPGWAAALLVMALLGDQVRWGRKLLPSGDPELFYPRTPMTERMVRLAGGPGGRAVGHDLLFYPALPSVYQLSDPRPHNPMASRDYIETLSAAFGFSPGKARYFDRFRNPEHPFLDFLGVRVILSNHSLPRVPGMKRRRPMSHYILYLNAEALPRRFLTDRVDLIERGDIGRWIGGQRDPRRIALYRDELDGQPPLDHLQRGSIRLLQSAPGEATLRVPERGTKLIASSIPGPTGWRIRSASGEALRTLTVNGAFLGIVVPPGVSTVHMLYRPPGLAAGLLIAGASALVLVALIGRRHLWPRPQYGLAIDS